MPPLVVGAPTFHAELARALSARCELRTESWARMYPPLLHRRPERDTSLAPALSESAYSLSHVDPRTWRRLVRRMHDWRPAAMVLPWFHPVMYAPFRYFLQAAPSYTARVLICHNVVPHELSLGWRRLTRNVLRRTDRLVIHASVQRDELAELGQEDRKITHLFHPRFPVVRSRDAAEVARLRQQLGDPHDLLLCFGIVRQYKGIDLAVASLTELVSSGRDARLIVAGRVYQDATELQRQIAERHMEHRVVRYDSYISDEFAGLLFAASDVTVLPYRSASQSGVAQLSLSHGCPVVATRVGGLSEAVHDGVDGVLCEPNDVIALTAAIERVLEDKGGFRARIESDPAAQTFDRYAELLLEGIRG